MLLSNHSLPLRGSELTSSKRASQPYGPNCILPQGLIKQARRSLHSRIQNPLVRRPFLQKLWLNSASVMMPFSMRSLVTASAIASVETISSSRLTGFLSCSAIVSPAWILDGPSLAASTLPLRALRINADTPCFLGHRFS
jgi:hypothetical protein